MQRSWFSLTAACLLLGACARAPAPDDYFPLGTGLHWGYQVTRAYKDRTEYDRLDIDNLKQADFDGRQVTVRRTGQDNHYYIERKPDGVYRVARRSVVETEPQGDKEPRMILPTPPGIGATWSGHTQPYALRRVHPYEDSLTRGIGFNMTYELVADDDTVQVPAGRYEHCLRIEGNAQVSIYSDARRGYRDIPIKTTEWYAPGVGLVKLVRDEPLDTEVFQGGTITLALAAFEY